MNLQIEVKGNYAFINGVSIKFDSDDLAEKFVIKFLTEWVYR